MSEVRQTLCRVVQTHPGIHFRGLGRTAGVTSAGQLRHNLDCLQRMGLLTEVQDGRYKRYFLVGEHEARLRPQVARFARDVPRQIGRLLLERPMNRAELRRTLGVSDSTLGYHLKRMALFGDVQKQRGRNCCEYSLPQDDRVRRAIVLAQGIALPQTPEPLAAPAPSQRLSSPTWLRPVGLEGLVGQTTPREGLGMHHPVRAIPASSPERRAVAPEAAAAAAPTPAALGSSPAEPEAVESS